MHRRTAKIILAGAILAILFGYTLFEFRAFLSGPTLSIETPSPRASVTTPLITVAGTARNIAEITLNGRPIAASEAGAWSEELLLAPGYSIITVAVRDRFGRAKKEQIEVILK